MGCGPSRPPPQNGFQLSDKPASFRPPPLPTDNTDTSPPPNNEMKKFLTSLTSSKSPSSSNGLPVPNSKPARRPEHQSQNGGTQNKAKEVARCAALLREMYSLDLEIWAMEEAHDDDVPEREGKKRRAEALFQEIRRVVNGWRGSGGLGWEEEEWRCVVDILEVVDRHGTRRY